MCVAIRDGRTRVYPVLPGADIKPGLPAALDDGRLRQVTAAGDRVAGIVWCVYDRPEGAQAEVRLGDILLPHDNDVVAASLLGDIAVTADGVLTPPGGDWPVLGTLVQFADAGRAWVEVG